MGKLIKSLGLSIGSIKGWIYGVSLMPSLPAVFISYYQEAPILVLWLVFVIVFLLSSLVIASVIEKLQSIPNDKEIKIRDFFEYIERRSLFSHKISARYYNQPFKKRREIINSIELAAKNGDVTIYGENLSTGKIQKIPAAHWKKSRFSETSINHKENQPRTEPKEKYRDDSIEHYQIISASFNETVRFWPKSNFIGYGFYKVLELAQHGIDWILIDDQ